MKVPKGAEVPAKVKEQVTQVIGGLEGPAPKLTIVRVGGKSDDMFYERGAMKKMENFGLGVQTYVFPGQMGDNDFKAGFSAISRDPDVLGILLLHPLPKQTAETDIEKTIDPEEDLDRISPANTAKVLTGDKTGFAPYTAEVIIKALKANEIDMTGKSATIVDRSMVVGRPLSTLMPKENTTVTICHARTRDLEVGCRRAEILVAAAGKTKMLDGRYVGQDAIIIDVGTNVDENGRLCGDVDFPSIEPPISIATPVPGGVGVMAAAVPTKYPVFAGRRQKGNQTASPLIPQQLPYFPLTRPKKRIIT